MDNVNIRKQVYDLTLEDLAQYPAWEDTLDEEVEGQDELTMRPLLTKDPVDGSAIVLTEFTLADGTVMLGYIKGQIGDKYRTAGYLQPTIVTESGQVGFWWGWGQMKDEWLNDSYRKLGKKPSEVFPVKYRSMHPVINGPITGMVVAFMGLSDVTTDETWSAGSTDDQLQQMQLPCGAELKMPVAPDR